MNRVKTIFPFAILFLPVNAIAQIIPDTVYMLDLRNQEHFKEFNKFWFDSSLIIRQEIAFNEAGVIDEEYSHYLRISLSAAAGGKMLYDLEKDSGLIQCSHTYLSVWHWELRETRVGGFVKMLSQNRNMIELDLTVTITEPGRRVYVYKGRRKFYRSKNVEARVANY